MQTDWKAEPSLVALQSRYKFTGPEMNKVLYHRNRMATPYQTKNGDPATIYATGVNLPDGRVASVPGYIGRGGRGRIVSNPDTLYKYWKNDIAKGRWPVYANGAQLNKRDALMHKVVMEPDMRSGR